MDLVAYPAPPLWATVPLAHSSLRTHSTGAAPTPCALAAANFWWHVWATYHDAGAPCLVGAIVGADAALQLETQLVEQNMYRWLSWTALPQFHRQPPLLCKVTRIISTALIYCNHNCYHNRVLVPVEHWQTTLARLLSPHNWCWLACPNFFELSEGPYKSTV